MAGGPPRLGYRIALEVKERFLSGPSGQVFVPRERILIMPKRRRINMQWTLWMAPVVTAMGTAVGLFLFRSPYPGASWAYLVWSLTGVLVAILFFAFTRDHLQDM